MSHVLLLRNDARALPLHDQSVHCVVTSPPYYHLRDYQTPGQLGLESAMDCLGWATGHPCTACYLCGMVAVFREVWRVLRDDGTCFVNIGDSYTAAGRTGHGTRQGAKQGTNRASAARQDTCRPSPAELKPKDLCGIPQRLALALQADGWYWRSEIIWAKPNPMPESVTDRPTKAHEQVLLLSKQERYFWDQEAVREPYARIYQNGPSFGGFANRTQTKYKDIGNQGNGPDAKVGVGANCRSVWPIPTEPMPLAHFATFPTALVERCIKAGSPRFCCPDCGAPYQRMRQRTDALDFSAKGSRFDSGKTAHRTGGERTQPGHRFLSQVSGPQPSCTCTAFPVPGIVYDPFVGSGTVPLVARALGRHGLGSDLSWSYLHAIARARLSLDALAAWQGAPTPAGQTVINDLPLFQEP